MSRSGYADDIGSSALALYRSTVDRALHGKRGQAFLREMLDALDAMPAKRLIQCELITADGECCALGSVAIKRRLDVERVDETEPDDVAAAFGIARSMAAEIAYVNDECGPWAATETPEQRWTRARRWVARKVGIG